jgi:DNA topoisomerase-1
MSKKYTTTTSLIIVESPAKCKKIEEYLGPGYKCLASFGHLRELSSLKNIDEKNNFNPTYNVIDNLLKKKQIQLLRKEIKSACEVILATDNDREGEAIAWHICELFKLDVLKTKRLIFNEITEISIQTAIKNLKTINLNMVHAQQARQILDILVGFKVSPMLWKFLSKNKKNALSAGRCQTPALRLINDNQREINNNNNNETKVFNTIGYFTNLNLSFNLTTQFETEHETTHFLNGSINFRHIFTCSQPIKVYDAPPEPFSTSRIQQVASNELHYAPKETMRICQQLYEKGLITYMRTDSKMYCAEFIDTVKSFVTKKYEFVEKYFNKNFGELTHNTKINKNTCSPQEAHEAIRPTNISLEDLPEIIDCKERKMYKLIWVNTLESCLTAASLNSVTANISAFENNNFTYTSQQIDFPGWKIVTKKYSVENNEYQYLQQIKQNISILYKKINSNEIIKGLKQHYTEAKLVQLLEKNGIGRPSTFAYIIDKIQERNYVKKEDIKGKEIVCKNYELENGIIFKNTNLKEFGNEKGKLVIQPLGEVVVEFLEMNFNNLFNYDFTCLMEESLDEIAKGEIVWFNLCDKCNKQIISLVDELNIKYQEKNLEIKLDENNTFLIGKFGPVIKCVEEKDGKEEIQFKSIKKDFDVKLLEKSILTVEDIVDSKKISKSQYILGQHNGNDIFLKKGKYGLYITWGKNTKTLKEFGNRPIENITFDEIKKYLEEEPNKIREINSNISIRKGPKGDYIFFKTSKMKKPEFKDIKTFTSETNEDYKICDINILKSWINEKYNI